MLSKASIVNEDQSPPLPSHEIELEVPFADVDAQRIVWHGNYFRYFELARVQLFAKCDLFSLIEEGTIDFVVSQSYCKHYRPLRFRDKCRVSVRFIDIDHRLHMRFLITAEDGTKVAKGHTHVVTLNAQGKLQLVTPKSVTERILAAGKASEEAGALSRRNFIIATGVLFSALAVPTPAAASQVPERLKKLLLKHQRSSGLYARFIEEKHIALLKVPLKNEGFLAYLRPDLFARIIEKPNPSKIVAHGQTLSFREGEGKKTDLSLQNRPELKALVDGVVFLLSGDAEQIQKLYELRVKTCAEMCQVELIPKDPRMRSLIDKFVVNEKSGELVSFEVHEKSGDYSVTKLVELDLDHEFSDEEKKHIFTI